MGTAYNTIAFKADLCDGCNACMTACADVKGGSSDASNPLKNARIQIVADEADGYGLALCRQCGDPKCVSNCPAGALTKNGSSGVIDWDGGKCVNCLLCTVGCSYGGIAHNVAEGHVVKCDTCGGDPACVKACPTGALKYLTTSRIYNEVGALEDLFVPGLAGCQGCNTELIMRHTLRRVGPETVLATPPGCIPGMGSVGYNGLTGTKVPVFHPLLTNTASMLTGIKRHYKRQGRKITAMALAGDGGASDVGFQSLSGAAERGEQILFICVDNEGYMNTGMQRSSCTPFGAWTTTTPVGEHGKGKTQDAKNMPVLMMMHNCAYVATASTAFMEDLYEKLDKAIAAAETGFAYLHIYSPCTTGWRFPSHENIEVARKAVETNFVMLWEFNPRDGLQLSRPLDQPLPLADYLEVLGKYRHLEPDQVAHIQASLERNVGFIKGLVKV
ncbi:NADH-dependent phenylglyoxylate dehydrogenase subunit beta [Herminiimonas sp. CN]|uniref:NADH-dependent phenylglyoxylate dehydrogenase subunit beta n=1 Tax=Herminiimonas sp. CN TaxID=1349818 RepID=UPI0004731AFD|nr:thiamine pyrophosphate-dependent enzyme [Herminiimonas sp. CN]